MQIAVGPCRRLTVWWHRLTVTGAAEGEGSLRGEREGERGESGGSEEGEEEMSTVRRCRSDQ